jgi:hypothetical protein
MFEDFFCGKSVEKVRGSSNPTTMNSALQENRLKWVIIYAELFLER